MGITEILKRKKNQGQGSDEIKCKNCNIIFKDKEHLSRHNKKAHGKKDDFLPSSNPFQV